MHVRFPFLKLFYNPAAAFRELTEPQTTLVVFFFSLGVSIFNAWWTPFGPNETKALGTLAGYSPWLSNPVFLRMIAVPSFLFATTMFACSAHGAASLIGGEAPLRYLWTACLFVMGVVGLLEMTLHSVPYIRWVLAVWSLVQSVVAISVIYNFSASPAIFTGFAGFLGKYLVFILAFLIGFSAVHTNKLREQRLRKPYLSTIRMPADYAWAVQRLDGKPMNMDELRGKVVVINFWATWCAPCRFEMPSLERLHNKVKDDGIVVMAVSEESPDKVQKFLKDKNYTFPIYTRYQRPPLFMSAAIPATFILSPDGFMVARQEGAAQWDAPEVIAYLHNLQARAGTSKPTGSGAGPAMAKAGEVYLGMDDRNMLLILNNEGIKLIRHRQFKDANDCFNRIQKILQQDSIVADSNSWASLYEDFGYLRYKEGKYAEAETFYKKALKTLAPENKLSPGVAFYYTNLANLYRAMHRLPEAEQADPPGKTTSKQAIEFSSHFC